jgi:hypothetical protein
MSSPAIADAIAPTSTYTRRAADRRIVRDDTQADGDDTRELVIAFVAMALAAFLIGFLGLTAMVYAGSVTPRSATPYVAAQTTPASQTR